MVGIESERPGVDPSFPWDRVYAGFQSGYFHGQGWGFLFALAAYQEEAKMMRWFGRQFDAPAWEDMAEAPTPVGEACLMCNEPILQGEAGVLMPCIVSVMPAEAAELPAHIECHLRSILGSPSHLQGTCSCVTGKPHDSGLSYREEARLVMSEYRPDWLAADA